jgi:hypothetical protein
MIQMLRPAPPLDEVNYANQIPQNHTRIPHIQQPRPVYLYPDIPNNIHYMTAAEQYNRDREIQMQMRKKQQEDDCCCFGLLTILCCCCIY